MTTTTIEVVQKEGSALAKELAGLVVTDTESYQRAGAYLVQVKSFLRRVADLTTPMLIAARANLKAAQEQDAALRKPALEAEMLLKGKMAVFETEERERDRAERARVAEAHRKAVVAAEALAQQETARRREEAEAARALDAELAGVPVESVPSAPVVAAMPAPVFTPPPVITPLPKAEGVTSREIWGAEVVDFKALVQAVAAGTVEIAVLQPNTTVLNGLARSMREALSIPGVRAVSKRVMAATAG